ncbi:MAG: response regulator transcription factor [bacterium]|nr:response regulator transcription factor [bacterium]
MCNNAAGHILIVDDEKSITELLKGWIDSTGYTISSASNGAEALQMAEAIKPDAIIMDASMPVMGGFEALVKMKNNPEICDIPVIFLTVRSDTNDIVSALDAGAADYIVKPFKPAILLARLRSAIRQKHFQDELKKQQAAAKQDSFYNSMDFIDVAIAIADSAGIITKINSCFASLVHESAENIIGISCEKLLNFTLPAEGTYIGTCEISSGSETELLHIVCKKTPDAGFAITASHQ